MPLASLTLIASLLLSLLGLAAPPPASADVMYSGCAGGSSCTLTELYAGGSITVDDKKFWSFAPVPGTGFIPTSNVIVLGESDVLGIGLWVRSGKLGTFPSGTEFRAAVGPAGGESILAYSFTYAVSVLDPLKGIDSLTLTLGSHGAAIATAGPGGTPFMSGAVQTVRATPSPSLPMFGVASVCDSHTGLVAGETVANDLGAYTTLCPAEANMDTLDLSWLLPTVVVTQVDIAVAARQQAASGTSTSSELMSFGLHYQQAPLSDPDGRVPAPAAGLLLALGLGALGIARRLTRPGA